MSVTVEAFKKSKISYGNSRVMQSNSSSANTHHNIPVEMRTDDADPTFSNDFLS